MRASSVHLVGGRADALDQRGQRVEVDAVDLGRGEAEDAASLVLGDVAGTRSRIQ